VSLIQYVETAAAAATTTRISVCKKIHGVVSHNK
jgi:hypothetical protein